MNKNVERIDAEIQKWREKQAEFRDSLERAKVTRAEAEAEREALLLRARAEGDSDALAQLEQATTRADIARREERDAATVLEQIGGKLAALTEARRDAELDRNRTEARKIAQQRMELAPQIDAAITALITLLRRHSELASHSAKFDAELGMSTTRHGRHLTAPRDALAWAAAQLWPGDSSLYRPGPWRRTSFESMERAVLGKDLLPTEPAPAPKRTKRAA